MYTDKITTHEIDLQQPEALRWSAVIEADAADAAALLEECVATDEHWVLRTQPALRRALLSPLSVIYKAIGGRYHREMAAWGAALNLSRGEVTAMNCIYELSPACTAGVVNVPRGPAHVRSLDWPLEKIGPATRLFRFVGGHHEFVAVGVVGHVGVFSGMVPGAYSVTINQAPSDGLGLASGASFLLRHVLETCATYSAAVQALKTAPLAASVFYVVCGATANQACVVERTRKDAVVRVMRGRPLVQANHFDAARFRAWNEPADEFVESHERADILQVSLSKTRSSDLEQLGRCLDEDQVFNDCTQQQMVFIPRTSEMKVWRYTP